MIQKTPENRLKYEEYTRKPLETGEGSVAISSLNQGEKCAKNIRKLKKNPQNQKIIRKRPKIRRIRQKTTENGSENLRIRSKKPTNHPKNTTKPPKTR